MKKIIIILFFAVPAIAKAQVQELPFKKNSTETSFLPFLKKGYRPQIGLSLLGGIQNNQNFDASSFAYGIEISLQCPLLCTKKNYIRQQFSIVRQEGNTLKSLAVEINPQYKLIAKPSFEFGIGPSAGLIFATSNKDNKTAFSYGIGTSATYYFSNFFIALETRYAFTSNVSFTNPDDKSVIASNLNNLRTYFKIGYKL